MNDRRAAETVGLNPDTAAYTKATPRVSAYMSEHRAAVTERWWTRKRTCPACPGLPWGVPWKGCAS
jgi:hypothetical protein